MKNLSVILFAVAVAGSTAHANGFLLNEFDARAVGRGNATAATESDASAIYYNVGGLAVGEGTQVMIGGSLIAPNASFTDAQSGIKTDSTTNPQVVPGVFVASRIHDMVAVGVGFYTPFGLAISWPDGSATNDVVHTQALHTFFITPSVGVNLGSFVPGLTVGGGIDLVPATVDIKQDIFFGTDTGSAHLGGTALGIGGRLGVMYKPHSFQQLSLGAMWRSEVKEDFSGTGNFDAPAPYRASLPQDGAVTTSITLPQSVTGGVAYRPAQNLELEANVVWTGWSSFKTLDIVVPSSTGGTMHTTTAENYSNTVTYRAGAELDMPLLGLGFRVGYIYDPTPVPTSSLTVQLPDVNRNDVTAGASKSFGNYDVHLGLLWVLPSTRNTGTAPYMPEHQGSFDVSAFVASVSLAGRFK